MQWRSGILFVADAIPERYDASGVRHFTTGVGEEESAMGYSCEIAMLAGGLNDPPPSF